MRTLFSNFLYQTETNTLSKHINKGEFFISLPTLFPSTIKMNTEEQLRRHTI